MNIIEKIEEFNVFGSKLGLERIEELLRRLGNPQEKLKIFHVAGTNGKGSVSKFLYEILGEAGYKVGIFTSPHIESFQERLQCQGKEISIEDLEKYGEKVVTAASKMIEDGWESPTEFEVVTALASYYFVGQNMDFAIMEVGLGGRGDSTNAAGVPVADIITSIGLDHMDRIGDTVEKIAWEKAGIIKEGVPVFMNVDKEEAKKIIAKEAYKKGCPLYDLSGYKLRDLSITKEGCKFRVSIKDKDFENVFISMAGEHQCSNAVTAMGTIEILRQKGIINVDENALSKGLKKAFQPGRFEILEMKNEDGKEKYFVLDGAHNEEGMEVALKTLDDIFYGKKVLVVTGILKDKAVDNMLYFLEKMGEEFITVSIDSPRTLDSRVLCDKIRKFGKKVTCCESSKEALKTAIDKMSDYDVCMCVGSLYLIGEMRGMLKDGDFFQEEN